MQIHAVSSSMSLCTGELEQNYRGRAIPAAFLYHWLAWPHCSVKCVFSCSQELPSWASFCDDALR